MLGFFAKEHSPFEILSRSFLVGLLGMLPRASLEPNKTLMQLARRVSNKHHTDSDSATSSIPFFFLIYAQGYPNNFTILSPFCFLTDVEANFYFAGCNEAALDLYPNVTVFPSLVSRLECEATLPADPERK